MARLAAGITLLACLSCRSETTRPTLTVSNAAALGPPFRDALKTFAGDPPRVTINQENAPSLEVVRKMTELGVTPDVLAVADESLLPTLVTPKFATWYVRFGTNALVLAYGDRARYADEITSENWWRVLLRPGVQVGRSDMRIDPSGYRADMVMQLAEVFYREPGLTARLRATIPEKNVRRAESDLSAHLDAGELDYGWTYLNLAIAHRLRYVRLPPEIDLSEPRFAARYALATVKLPQPAGQASLTVRGAPIVFALTIPKQATQAGIATDFVRYLLSPEDSAALRRSGFSPLAEPEFVGEAPLGLTKR